MNASFFRFFKPTVLFFCAAFCVANAFERANFCAPGTRSVSTGRRTGFKIEKLGEKPLAPP
ncbi:hypothetical protein UF64_11425 [Thalassospira sp. HJ]|nr:hypothetical protein UF64_11425 [Thalassospira sp. HJ]